MNARYGNQRGFSLIELMVAMVLGVVLMLGVVNIFSSVRASTQLEQNLSRMQENGRFLMNFMLKELHEAGYAGPPGQELTLDPISKPSNGVTNDGGGTAADTIEVNYASDYNCAGTAQGFFALKTVSFSWSPDVDPTANTSPGITWTCTFNGVVEVNNQALADGVETFQVLYGEDTDDDSAPNQFVDAGSVANWNKVVSLEVGIIVQSQDTKLALTTGTPAPIPLLGQNFNASAEQRLQKPFMTTIALRNVINM